MGGRESFRFVYHTLNRSNGRAVMFSTVNDYAAFERVLEETFFPSPYPP